MNTAERRLVPVIAGAFLLWMTRPLLVPSVRADSLTDATIAVLAGLAIVRNPRRHRADTARLARGRSDAVGRDQDVRRWAALANALLPLAAVLLPLVVLVIELASNVATASGMMPVVASLALALGTDPYLFAMLAALAANWGFMLPAGTGPDAIGWTAWPPPPQHGTARLVLDRGESSF